jgi:hypothetical protein
MTATRVEDILSPGPPKTSMWLLYEAWKELEEALKGRNERDLERQLGELTLIEASDPEEFKRNVIHISRNYVGPKKDIVQKYGVRYQYLEYWDKRLPINCGCGGV